MTVETGRLPRRRRPADVRPDRAGLRRDEPRHDRRARPALAQGDGPRDGAAGRPRPRRVLRHRRPRRRARSTAGAASVVGLDFSERMLERARRKAPELELVQGDVLALPFEDASFDVGGRRLRRPQRRGPRGGARELRRVLRPGGRLGILEITTPRGVARAVLPALVRPHRAAARPRPARRRRVHVPARERAPLPGARGARGAARRERLRGRAVPALRRRHRRAARGGGRS